MPDFGRWTANGGDPSLNDINRADRYLDALAFEQPVYSTDRGDADLAALLTGWRDEVRQVPMDHVLTSDAAAAALTDAVVGPRRRNRLSLAVVGSAAAAVVCLGGFGTAVFAAGPGDGLYGVRSMFFAEQRATREDAVVLAAQTELAQVQQMVDEGQWDQAQDKLAALSSTVQNVDQVERKQELIQQWNALTYKVVEQDPAATLPPPGDPLPVLPPSPLTLLPVPVIEDSPSVTITTPSELPAVSPGPSPSELPSESPGPEILLNTPPSESPTSDTAEPSATTAPSTTSVPSTSASTTTTSATAAPVTTASPTTTTAPATTTPATTTPVTTTPVTTTPTTSAPATTTTAPSSTTQPKTAEPTTTTTVAQSTTVTPPRVEAPSEPAQTANPAPAASSEPAQAPVESDEEAATTTVPVPGSGAE